MKPRITIAVFFVFFMIAHAHVPGVIPVHDLSLSQSGSWPWQFISAPLGNASVENILVDPQDDQIWYVSSISDGLYITRDGGQSWTHALTGPGLDAEGYQIDPADPTKVYAGVWNKLYLSEDKGRNWRLIYTCPEYIRSILLSRRDGSIYLGPQTEGSTSPGVYKSTDGGLFFEKILFGVQPQRLICWDIAEDAQNAMLYISSEIADHPQPYKPPFFRSSDGGQTWQETVGVLPWHALKLLIDPFDQTVYYQVEAGSLYRSSDLGRSWQPAGYSALFGLWADPRKAGRIYGSCSHPEGNQGAWLSEDHGSTFARLGLDSLRVSSMCLNAGGDKLYATCYGSGVWMSLSPSRSEQTGIIVTRTADAGAGTFRDAIQMANTHFGPDTIRFAIPQSDAGYDAVSGTWTFHVTSAWPTVTDDSLCIDGNSQRAYLGADANPKGPEIVIQGDPNVPYISGLDIGSAGNSIYHLAINSFQANGIVLYGAKAKGNLVTGCYIGVDAQGLKALPNQTGVRIIDAPQNRIGESTATGRNIISGHLFEGIIIAGANGNENYIEGNWIGLSSACAALGNGGRGIYIADGVTGTMVARNQIAHNSGYGLSCFGSSTRRNTFTENRIFANEGGGIALLVGANDEMQPPELVQVLADRIQGTAAPYARVELFSDQDAQGGLFEATLTADPFGQFQWQGRLHGPNVTATGTDSSGNTSGFSLPARLPEAAVSLSNGEIPLEFFVSEGYPNPFNPLTQITYGLPHAGPVRARIFDMRGAQVAVLLDRYQAAGRHALLWNGCDAAGRRIASGAYFLQLEHGGQRELRKLLLLR